MSLMTSLSVGVSGLRTSQSAVNTTAHNLANVSTAGYCRQQSLATDFGYNTIGFSHISYFQIGIGTEVQIIKQNRDAFLDKSYRLEVGRQNFYEAQSRAVEEIESLFGEMEGVQFQESLSDIWSSIQELAKEPDSIVKRTALIETSSTFMLRAQDIYEQLEEYQNNLNTQVKDAVARINKIGQEIMTLNRKIAKCEAGSEQANDYRDKRNVLLDELGESARISYKEDLEGRITVNLEGTQFISTDYVYEIVTEPMSDSTRLLNVLWKDSNPVFNLDQKCNTAQNTDVGKLKGLLVARGDHIADYTDIPQKENYYDENGNFNSNAYDEDVRKYNISINSSIIMSTQAGFDQLVHGVVTAINDALCPNASIENTLNNLNLSTDDTSISYSTTRMVGNVEVEQRVTIDDKTGRTVELYLKGSDAPVYTKTDSTIKLKDVLIWDEYNAPIGMDDNSTPREELFIRQGRERYSETVITVTVMDEDGNEKVDENGNPITYEKTIWVYNEEDEGDAYSLYTIDQLLMNENITQDPSKIPLTQNQYQEVPGAYDADVCDRLLNAWDEDFATLNPNVLTRNNFSEYYQAFIGDIATVGYECKSMYANQEDLVADIDDGRQQVQGVSSDEELTNLIMYQHAYNASSRYITAVDAMLEDLLAKLG